MDIRKEGTVRYAAIENGSSTVGDTIISNVSSFVNSNLIPEDEPAFKPTWALVAQWDQVHPHPHGSDNHDGIDKRYLNRVSVLSDT